MNRMKNNLTIKLLPLLAVCIFLNTNTAFASECSVSPEYYLISAKGRLHICASSVGHVSRVSADNHSGYRNVFRCGGRAQFRGSAVYGAGAMQCLQTKLNNRIKELEAKLLHALSDNKNN